MSTHHLRTRSGLSFLLAIECIIAKLVSPLNSGKNVEYFETRFLSKPVCVLQLHGLKGCKQKAPRGFRSLGILFTQL